MRVSVVGAGVSGLTCALRLSEAGHAVEVITRDDPLTTTSSVAAAVWYPLRGEVDDRVKRWLPVSFDRFVELARFPERTGVALRAGIELFREPRDDTWWRDVLPNFRHARSDELPDGYADGFVADGVPVIEMPVYLSFLVSWLAERGVVVARREVGSLDEVEGNVVVNCTGLGARALCADDLTTPVRGQVVRVRQFSLERYVLDEHGPDGITYVYPRAHDVVCGGTREAGSWNVEPDPATARAILERCARLEPRIAQAEVLTHGVGLRPGRSSVRLEAEGRVIHDYGHGGSGVTLSWGCAADVVALVEEAAHNRGIH
jgi:D-amino-acid oxidase